MLRIILVLSILVPLLSIGQQTLDGFDPSKNDAKPAESQIGSLHYETLSEFPGGDEAMYQFIGENTQYPEEALSQGIEGKVFVRFIIETSGELSNIEILRGIGGGCDEETIRVLSLMPKWVPATNRGKPIATENRMSFYFNMEDQPKKKKRRRRK